MNLKHLPIDILGKIYEFDPTYRIILNNSLGEIEDEVINRSLKKFVNVNIVDVYIRFLGTINNINIRMNHFNYSQNFTKMKYVIFLEDRFIYCNKSLHEARKMNIDTRIKFYEWYLVLDNIHFISCINRKSQILLNISSQSYFNNMISFRLNKVKANEIKNSLENQFNKIKWHKIYINHFTSPCGNYIYKNSLIKEYGNYLTIV